MAVKVKDAIAQVVAHKCINIPCRESIVITRPFSRLKDKKGRVTPDRLDGSLNIVFCLSEFSVSDGKYYKALSAMEERKLELAEQIVRVGNRPRMGRRGAELSALDNLLVADAPR
jgi:hypothetical protein